VAVLSGIGLLMTVGVYGLVAAIVKMDDAGAWLLARGGRLQAAVGRALLLAAPKLMKALTVIGTAAMFLVGGGILMHGLPGGHTITHAVEALAGPLAVSPPAWRTCCSASLPARWRWAR
jgi:predicted DNA repair protein MutK